MVFLLCAHHSSSDEEEVGASEIQGHAVLYRELEASLRCLRLCLRLQYRGNWEAMLIKPRNLGRLGRYLGNFSNTEIHFRDDLNLQVKLTYGLLSCCFSSTLTVFKHCVCSGSMLHSRGADFRCLIPLVLMISSKRRLKSAFAVLCISNVI